ncbi:MAG: hypothetical protein ACREEE_01935 [Dongiaceae bacterium]
MPTLPEILWSLAVLLGLSASFLAPQISVMVVIAYCMLVTMALPFVMARFGLRGVRAMVRVPRIVQLVPRRR